MKRVLLTVFMASIYSQVSFAPTLPKYAEQVSNRIIAEGIKKEIEERAKKICLVIKYIESRGRHDRHGKSGEKGAYQFMPNTWKKWCIFIGKTLDINNPKHQDLVAHKKVEYLLHKGYSPSQVASIWNCGKPNWKGVVGINRQGVRYDVPAYVSLFRSLYYTDKI